MRFLSCVVVCSFFVSQLNAKQAPPPRDDSSSLSYPFEQTQAQLQSQASSSAADALSIPAGTKVALALTAPVWSTSAKLGDGVYATAAFPVSINGRMAIPVGTYVQGTIDEISRPNWHSNRAEFQMHFTTLIYANGYAVSLASAVPQNSATVGGSQNVTDSPNIAAAIANVYVEVSSRSDILLDNGSQLEMVFQTPIALDAARVAAAALMAKPPQLTPVRSATRCRPIPATPGTPDTVIPGTPGTPGTPPTVIPGGPGMPDTVIPGTPGTTGTPPTVISGSPGSPGRACPAPPMVLSSANSRETHSGSFELLAAAQVAGKQVEAGSYQVNWIGPGPVAQVTITQKGKVVANVPADVKALATRPSQNSAAIRTNPDNSVAVTSLVFVNQTLALFFESLSAQNF